MSGIDLVPQRKAEEILALGYSAWQQGSSREERDRLVRKKTLELVTGIDVQVLKQIRDSIAKTLGKASSAASGMAGKTFYYGSVASSGPNSALDVPREALQVINSKLN